MSERLFAVVWLLFVWFDLVEFSPFCVLLLFLLSPFCDDARCDCVSCGSAISVLQPASGVSVFVEFPFISFLSVFGFLEYHVISFM